MATTANGEALLTQPDVIDEAGCDPSGFSAEDGLNSRALRFAIGMTGGLATILATVGIAEARPTVIAHAAQAVPMALKADMHPPSPLQTTNRVGSILARENGVTPKAMYGQSQGGLYEEGSSLGDSRAQMDGKCDNAEPLKYVLSITDSPKVLSSVRCNAKGSATEPGRSVVVVPHTVGLGQPIHNYRVQLIRSGKKFASSVGVSQDEVGPATYIETDLDTSEPWEEFNYAPPIGPNAQKNHAIAELIVRLINHRLVLSKVPESRL
jgi:hypothetical protein